MTTTIRKAYSAPKSQRYAFVAEQLLAISPEIGVNNDGEVDAGTSFSNAKSWDGTSWTNHPAEE
ncbi:hypothetical protein [Prevotellamassilia timonensis]|jgi:hypothetical protein|uniref:hypothetical protein n=1 Tax=Prevotellamassilia timonensis TaxID=1852370 RepID=UPI004029D146